MEILEDIQTTLSIAGELLTFQDFEILSLPGFNTSVLYKAEVSVYEVEKQNFVFRINTIDEVENSIIEDMEFDFEDTAYIYTFRLSRNPLSDLMGWSSLYADLIKKVVL